MALRDTILQAAMLSMFSNILAQVISSYRSDTPLSIDFAPVLQFVAYAIINTPINVVWQNWLESTFPSTTAAAQAQAANKEKDPKASTGAEGKLNVTNTAAKFILDQTVGAAFNIPLFIGIIGVLKGQSVDQIINRIHEDSLDIYLSGMKLWPPVSLASFAFIPPQHRVIFGSIAGVIWTVYLSLKAS